MIWNLFQGHKSKTVTDEQIADVIAGMLELQLFMAGDKGIESEAGGPKPKAIGYVSGFVNAVLRTKGWGEATVPAVTYQVLRRLWPGKELEYIVFLVEHLELSDPLVVEGFMHGDHQYLDTLNPENSDNVPMGLGRYIVTET